MNHRTAMKRTVMLASLGALLVACSGGTTPSPSPSPSPTVVSAASTPPPTASVAPSPSPAVAAITPIPGCLPACVPGGLSQPGELPAGDYTTEHFFGGQLTVTTPEGWSSFEDSTGEFAMAPMGTEGAAVLFWLDIYPAMDPTNEPVPGIDPSLEGVFTWLEANPNVEVSLRREATLGGLPAQAVRIWRSSEAVNVDPECPAEGRPCVGLFGFPQWEFNFSQGGPFYLRLIAADASWGGERHVIYAMTAGGDFELYSQIESAAKAMIASAKLPIGVEGAK